MKFKDTFMYRVVTDVWGRYSSMDVYPAALATPLFLFLLIVMVPVVLLIDIWYCSKYLFEA